MTFGGDLSLVAVDWLRSGARASAAVDFLMFAGDFTFNAVVRAWRCRRPRRDSRSAVGVLTWYASVQSSILSHVVQMYTIAAFSLYYLF